MRSTEQVAAKRIRLAEEQRAFWAQIEKENKIAETIRKYDTEKNGVRIWVSLLCVCVCVCVSVCARARARACSLSLWGVIESP